MLNLFRSAPAAARPDPRALVQRALAGEVTLIDIREPGEIAATGIAKGALRIPLATLRMKADPASPECHPDLTTDRPVVIYCASGARASMAKGMLDGFGYAEVHNLGGLSHWAQAGGPVVR